jgi:c-di-AMP phosphodiesterase-like protein
MDYKKYINQRSLIYFIVIFIMLFILTSFVKFIGQMPILIIISLLLTYYFYSKYNSSIDTQINSIGEIQNKISNMLNNKSNYNTIISEE